MRPGLLGSIILLFGRTIFGTRGERQCALSQYHNARYHVWSTIFTNEIAAGVETASVMRVEDVRGLEVGCEASNNDHVLYSKP